MASLKRPASTHSGAHSKKQKRDTTKAKPEKKRSQPVTSSAPVVQGDSDDTDEELDDAGFIEEVAQDEDKMDVDSIPNKDPGAAREAHKAQKVLQDQRRAAKPHSSLLVEAKRIWSLARQNNIASVERTKYIKQLMDVMRGKVKDVVFKHDASRIVQTVVKWGGQKERDEVAVELKGKYKELAQNKYSKFLVTKLIRLCPTHRPAILLEFQGSVLRMLLHREATVVLSDAFELYANAYERTILLQDFYGKEASLFSVTKGTEQEKERAKKGLPGVLEGADKERSKRVLASVKQALVTIFNNPDKGAIGHAIVHRVLWEYLIAVSSNPDDTEREKLRREMFESCQEVLAEMVHTKDGGRVVREFIAQGTAKDRKQILKVLKPHVERMSTNDEAQLVLFTAMDVIDDTKLVLKTIVSDLVSHASTLYTSSQGRRSLFYSLVPRTRRHFTPAQIASLAETDELRSKTSKKEPSIREEELRAGASEEMIEWVKSNAEDVVRDPGGSLVLLEVMLYAVGDKKEAIEALLLPLSAPYPSVDLTKPHVIDLPHTSRVYKSLLQGGHFNHTTKTVDRVPSWNSQTFGVALVESVDGDVITGMCTKGDRNGAFVVAELCAALEDGDTKAQLKKWFSKSVRKEIENGEGKGKKVLLDKLDSL